MEAGRGSENKQPHSLKDVGSNAPPRNPLGKKQNVKGDRPVPLTLMVVLLDCSKGGHYDVKKTLLQRMEKCVFSYDPMSNNGTNGNQITLRYQAALYVAV